MKPLKFSLLVSIVLSGLVGAQAVEPPPSFRADQVLPAYLLQGPGHRVRDFATSDGILIHFTIDTDYGVMYCRGRREVIQRVNEMAAIRKLVATSKGDLFAEGMKRSLESPIDAVKNIAQDPKGSLKKAPETVGHFFAKVGSSLSGAADKVQNKMSGGDSVGTAEGIGKSAKSVVGFDKAKLDCARQLGVDPYSDNKLLQSEMDKVTWAFFAGGLPLKLGAAAVSGGTSTALAATKAVGIPEDIYDVTPSELLLRDRQSMQKMGVSQALSDAVLLNKHLSVSLRHGIIKVLETLPGESGRHAVLQVASGCETEAQARFLYHSLRSLKSRQASSQYVAMVTLNRMPAGVTKKGVIEVVAPVDYVSWTERMALFAQMEKAADFRYRLVCMGSMSPMAKSGFEAAAWQVEVLPAKVQP